MLKYMAGATVITLAPTATVSEAARVMKSKNIGSVVILTAPLLTAPLFP